MSNHIQYKGYTGTVEYTAEDDVLFGSVIGIRGLISYEGDSLITVKKDFMEAIDDYLEMCASKGIEPEKPMVSSSNTLKTSA